MVLHYVANDHHAMQGFLAWMEAHPSLQRVRDLGMTAQDLWNLSQKHIPNQQRLDANEVCWSLSHSQMLQQRGKLDLGAGMNSHSQSAFGHPVHVCTAQVVSVDKWVIRDRERGDQRVIYYQPPGVGANGQAFVLCLTSPFFLDAAVRFGNGRAVLMDATFGMCKHRVRSCSCAADDSAAMSSVVARRTA